ncbi:MAG: hypothetical protein JXX14_06155, partial [Deltaproteobacteria bacterium]|nr:hypothetical protein [Deltaproteobacteria bacterium]
HRLVDKLGTLNDAIGKARALAKASTEVKAVLYPKPKSFMEMLGEQLAGGSDARIQLAKQFDATRHALELSVLLENEQVLTLCPVLFAID